MFQLRKIKAGNPEESKASVDNGFVKENGLQTEENDVFTQEEIYIEEPDIEEPDIEDNSNVTEMDSPNNFADEMLEVKSEVSEKCTHIYIFIIFIIIDVIFPTMT